MATLAERAQVGGAVAPPPVVFQDVYAEHATFVWRSLRRLGVRPADLEDVCQEVFMVVHRKLVDFDRRSTVRTWVFGICLRVASDYRKRAHIRREDVVETTPDEAQAASQVDAIQKRQAREVLYRVLNELDDEPRSAFILYELEQWPMAEVAASLGCPLKTAYSRLYAARRHVEEAIARLQGKGEGGGTP